MKAISNQEAALLGLLAERPMYPYQIEREVEYRDMRSWADLSMSSIYKLLAKLEKNGLVVRANEVTAENRLRKQYTISDAGSKALREKLKALLSVPEHSRWQVDIGTYNCDLLPPKARREALKKYRKGLEANVKCYEELHKFLMDCGCPPHRFAVATRPIYLLKGEIAWLDEYAKALDRRA